MELSIKRLSEHAVLPQYATPGSAGLDLCACLDAPLTLERHAAPVESAPDRIVLRDTGGRLTAAPWDGEGRLAVENGMRTIKRLFTDAGIPVERRWDHPALLLDGKPAAVLGVAVDWKLRPEAGKPCRVITFRRTDEGRTP